MPPTWGPGAIYLLISIVLATKDGPCGRECMPPLHIRPPSGPPRPLPGLEPDTGVAPPRPGGKGQGPRAAEQAGGRDTAPDPRSCSRGPGKALSRLSQGRWPSRDSRFDLGRRL